MFEVNNNFFQLQFLHYHDLKHYLVLNQNRTLLPKIKHNLRLYLLIKFNLLGRCHIQKVCYFNFSFNFKYCFIDNFLRNRLIDFHFCIQFLKGERCCSIFCQIFLQSFNFLLYRFSLNFLIINQLLKQISQLITNLINSILSYFLLLLNRFISNLLQLLLQQIDLFSLILLILLHQFLNCDQNVVFVIIFVFI